MKNLNLFSPQWQDSGKTNELYLGAHKVKKLFKNRFNFVNVKVPKNQNLKIQNGILGYSQIVSQLKNCRNKVLKNKPDKIFTLGGGCGVEVSPISYLNKKYNGDLAVIWIDAHADLNNPTSSPNKEFHGMPLMVLLGKGDKVICNLAFSCLKKEQIVLCGFRDFIDLHDKEYIKKNNIKTFLVKELKKPNKVVKFIKNKGFNNIYIHIDLDVIDPKYFPYVKCPTPNGITVGTLIKLIKTLKNNLTVVGHSILESTSLNKSSTTVVNSVIKSLFNPYFPLNKR